MDRSARQQHTRDRIAQHRRRHRETLIEAARSQPITDKISCDAGWVLIVIDFMTAADKYPEFVLLGAGEKWGILDLDYHVDASAAAAVRALEQDAVDESSITCEVCGSDGHLRTEGWRKTLCDRHVLERRLTLTEDEHERLMTEFTAAQDRWRPVLARHRDDDAGSDQLFESFLHKFQDLDPLHRRFWAMHLTRIVLAGRDRR